MMIVYLTVTGLLFLGLSVAAGCNYADYESKIAAYLVISAFFSWAWPVALPLAILFGLINLSFFVVEELTEWERPEWWPVQP